jgi:ribonuclease VapC
MVIDSSALVAIVHGEPEAKAMMKAMASTPGVISAVTLFESSMVVESRWGSSAMDRLKFFLDAASVEVIPFDETQAELARRAWKQFGKGRHSGRLNFGDCCVYALATLRGETILAKGDDFARTPIQVVALDFP